MTFLFELQNTLINLVLLNLGFSFKRLEESIGAIAKTQKPLRLL
ncbi:MAG: hypothetical protein RM049_08655 [Nostoc sp. DedQUE04]|nr:hypothetical protein [Nostoc sp. DedQUE04]MDZ8135363.1 hypothetical protein [Nostoc sp. DedQUE04]